MITDVFIQLHSSNFHLNPNRYNDELNKESDLRNATEGRELDVLRENSLLRYSPYL
jgi:hypothetical protein